MGLHEFLTFTTTEKTHYHLNKVRTRAMIRIRYNQAPYLTQYTNGKMTISQLDIANESQEDSPLLAGDNKASHVDMTSSHILTPMKTHIQ